MTCPSAGEWPPDLWAVFFRKNRRVIVHGRYVELADRESEPQRPARGVRPARRWILKGPVLDAEPQSFDRRAIALRALQSAADGTQLVDGLNGEVLAAAGDGSVRD